MNSTASRLIFKSRQLFNGKQLQTINSFDLISNRPNIQIYRNYKNFGHAREEHSAFTFLWSLFLLFGMSFGSLRYFV